MKNILLLVLLSITFLGCKKDEGASGGSSRDVKYEWTSETSETVNILYIENAISGISESYTGKAWSKAFAMDSQPGMLFLSISANELLYEQSSRVINGNVKIYIGGKVVKSQDVRFNSQNFYVMLQMVKPN